MLQRRVLADATIDCLRIEVYRIQAPDIKSKNTLAHLVIAVP